MKKLLRIILAVMIALSWTPIKFKKDSLGLHRT